MSAMEKRLREALDARARELVPDDAAVPPMRAGLDAPEETLATVTPLRPRRWVAGLAVAAALVLGIVAIDPGRFLATEPGQTAVPTTPSPEPTVVPTESGPAETLAPSPAPTGSVPVATPTATAGARLVDIGGGARIAVPQGWTLTRSDQRWCLDRVGAKAGTCEVTVAAFPADIVPAGETTVLDIDTDGGLETNPQYCGPGASATMEAADVTWGGRPADFRAKTYGCGIRTAWYVVPTWPAYTMFTETATAEVRAVMATVAAQSVLPAQSRPVRLTDFGVIRSITRSGTGYTIALDRAIQAPGGVQNNSPATYTYTVASLQLPDGGQVAVGDTVKLGGDGTSVQILWRLG